MILVELGATLASKVQHEIQQTPDWKPDVASLMSFYQNARDGLFEVMAVDPENSHSVDVMSWLCRDLLSSDQLEPKSRAEVEADILHVFAMADSEDYSPEQSEHYQRRKMELAPLLGKVEMADEAFDLLVAQGSKAGYYIRAWQMAGAPPKDRVLTSEEQTRCAKAESYLENHKAEIAGDSRCLNLLLKLWWMTTTARPMFLHERECVPVSH